MSMNSKRSWLFLLLAALAAFTMLFAACGGGDDDDDSGGSDTSATATKTPKDTGNGGGEETDKPTAEPTDTSGDNTDDILAQLQNLGGDAEHVTGKVGYTMTDTDGAVSNMTVYSKEGKTRLDSVDSDGATSTIIETSDKVYVCDDGSQSCISYTSDQAGGLGLGFLTFFGPAYVDALVAAAESEGVDVKKSNENIAGTDASCYSGESSDGTGKFCFSDAGFMVYEEFTDSNGTFKLEATDVSTDVSDSDFEPPYDVTELPGQ